MQDDYFVAATNQASNSIVVFDPKYRDWNDPDAVVWSWKPRSTNGFKSLVDAWSNPSDVKLRRSTDGEQFAIAVASGGLALMVPYPAGNRKKWACNVGGNPHEIELLPDGNIAVASSTGGFVRLYTASVGPDSSTYDEYVLPGAHGVLWDPKRSYLWALGDEVLVALQISGKSSAPSLKEVYRKDLPSLYGHDLFSVTGDSNKMWVTTNTEVLLYDKAKGEWSSPAKERINRGHVKGIGNQPTGQVVQTTEGGISPWVTDTIDFFIRTNKEL